MLKLVYYMSLHQNIDLYTELIFTIGTFNLYDPIIINEYISIHYTLFNNYLSQIINAVKFSKFNVDTIVFGKNAMKEI